MSFAGIRVALVGPLPPPSGGMAILTQQLATVLCAERAQVSLVQTNAEYRPRWAGRIPVLRATFRLVPYIAAVWAGTKHSNVVHIMANSGWAWHLFAAPAIWLAKLRGVPVVVNYHGGEAASFLAKSHRLVRCSMRWVEKLVVPSAFLQDVFARAGLPAMVVPNIVDLTRFQPRATRCGSSAHLIVTRNLELLYDNATALRAFQAVRIKFPAARLTIAGSGPEEAALRKLAADLGLREAVHFSGRLDRDAMAALYASADVMLNPSLADNLPGSVLEALASGVPVVSTNVGGVPYMVQDGVTALLVPPATPSAMAAAVLAILQDNGLWQRLADAGVVAAQSYTWSRVRPLWADVYHQAIAMAKVSPREST